MYLNLMKNNSNNRAITLHIQNLVNNKKYDEALNLLNKLANQNTNQDFNNKIKGLIYLNQKNWVESISHYSKISKEKVNFEISNNIGIGLFKLGRLSDASNKFKETMENKKEYIPAYENFCITNKLMGNYEISIKYSLIALKLMPDNNKIINNLLDILNYFEPKKNQHIIFNINDQIKEVNLKNNKNKFFNTFEIKKILNKSDEILKDNNFNNKYPHTQIFKKNSTNLNCERHLSIFSSHKIIPRFCFGCYKVQMTVNKVLNLIKLQFYLKKLSLRENNIRKCIVELRENIAGNYKGYVFCSSIKQAEDIKKIIANDLKGENIKIDKIEIKHGCSEYYEEFKVYENSEDDVTNEVYKEEWIEIEKKFDKDNFILENNKERVFDKTLNLFNLPDFLIIKNWLTYAKILGDDSYKEIFKSEIEINHLSQFEIQKISKRKKYLLN